MTTSNQLGDANELVAPIGWGRHIALRDAHYMLLLPDRFAKTACGFAYLGQDQILDAKTGDAACNECWAYATKLAALEAAP